MSNKCGGLSTTLCGVATTRMSPSETVTPRAVSLRSAALTLLPFPSRRAEPPRAVTGGDTDSDGPHPTDTPPVW